ncbi:MAG: NrsF family protein [Variibacter sp.]
METDKLIQGLVARAEPVSRLPSPPVRLARWLALGIPYVALVVLAMSPRPDLTAKLTDPSYIVEQLAALATGFAAGFAAFASVVPAYDRRCLLLPLVPFAVWLGILGFGCLQSWIQVGAAGLSIQPDWFCFPAIVLVGMIPAITMALMVRRGAPLTPHLTTALGGLAAAGIGNFGLRLFHPQDASIMVLIWQMGTVFILTAFAGWAGGLLLNWKSLTENIRRKIVAR